MPDARLDGVAIVGMACVFPGAGSVEQFWSNICAGVDAVTDVPATRWDPVFHDPSAAEGAPRADRFYCRRGGFVDDLATFDPARFGIMPVVVDGAEPDQLLALATADRALDDAGRPHERVAPEKVGVLLGRGGYRTAGVARLDQQVHVTEQVVEALRSLVPDLDDAQLEAVRAEFQSRLGPTRPEAAIGLVPNLAASRIANRLDLRGPAYTIDAACASSLLAVDQACAELASGRCDVVLAGGVHHCHDLTLWSVFSQLRALSPSGCIRPFDRDADGIVIGEGTGIVVLKRLADAEAEGDRIYAVIRGTGVASDGRDTSLMSPGVEGQVAAVEQAWQRAGLDPETVGLVEAHGTATPAGDEVELETLRRVFGKDDAGRSTAGLGSVKSMIGHTMPAAGAAGLIKAALAIHHGILPPTLHVEQPHPHLANGRFRLLDLAEPWAATPHPRRAGVNAFGFGGINTHVVLEAAPSAVLARDAVAPSGALLTRPTPSRSLRSVPSPSSRGPVQPPRESRPKRAESSGPGAPGPLVLLAGRDVQELRSLLDAYVSGGEAAPREASGDGPARLAILAPDARRLTLAAKVLDRGEPWRGRNDLWFEPEGLMTQGGRLAFLFPGVEPLFEPQVGDLVDHFGRPCDWARPGASALEQQGHGVIAVGRLLHDLLGELGIAPDVVAGHSLGEWSGEIATGVIPPGLVEAFVDRVRPGAIEVPDVVFLALGCGVDVAGELLDGLPEVVVSHDNCPHQSVVCGRVDAIAAVRERARRRQVLAEELPFRSGFHSPMFEPYLERVREQFADLPLQASTAPMWSATTCEPYPADPEAIRALAARHLVEPVRFRELTLRLHDEGVRVFVQVGVGSLAAFVGDTLREVPHLAIAANTAKASGREQLARVAAALWVEGRGVDFDPLDLDLHGRASGDQPSEGEIPDRAPAGSGPTVRLRLGTTLVRDLTPLPRSTGAGQHLSPAVAAGHPLLADVMAVGDDVLAASAAILNELAATEATPPGRGQSPASAAPLPASTADPVPQPISPPAAAPVGISDTGSLERELVLSVDEQPAWLDHAFYRQPEGWPAPEDRFPLVPMTGILEMMGQLALELDPQRVVVAIEDVRAFRWLRVDPPARVQAKATADPPAEDGTRRVRVSIEGHARATIVLAPEYDEALAVAEPRFVHPRAVSIDGSQVYELRWMFHGPQYQGIRAFHGMGDDGIAGVLESLPAPGALLDNAGQLIGCWMQETVERDRLALPVSIERIRFFGPHPSPGARVDCAVRIRELAPQSVRCDLTLAQDGRLWCEITDWNDRRFGTDPILFEMLCWPEKEAVAEVGEHGFAVVRESWRDSALRDLVMRRYLTGPEQAVCEAHHPNAQRQFLLGRIAAKDAIRRHLWTRGYGALYPAEIELANEASGRPVIVRSPGGDDLRISIAHSTGIGVALVGDGRDVGIDIEQVEERSSRFEGMVLTESEMALEPLPELADARDAWLTALWAAKEAAAKAEGSGLQGRPKEFEATIHDGHLVVIGRSIGVERIVHEGKEYVVAWTTG